MSVSFGATADFGGEDALIAYGINLSSPSWQLWEEEKKNH